MRQGPHQNVCGGSDSLLTREKLTGVPGLQKYFADHRIEFSAQPVCNHPRASWNLVRVTFGKSIHEFSTNVLAEVVGRNDRWKGDALFLAHSAPMRATPLAAK